MIAQYPLTSLSTLAAIAVCFVSGLLVARARRRFNVKAPATTGDPAFERALRAQQNMVEWMPMFLPALWLFALGVSDRWAGVLGLIWAAARLGYLLAYGAAAERRGPYFAVQAIAFVVLWFGALYGILLMR